MNTAYGMAIVPSPSRNRNGPQATSASGAWRAAWRRWRPRPGHGGGSRPPSVLSLPVEEPHLDAGEDEDDRKQRIRDRRRVAHLEVPEAHRPQVPDDGAGRA